MIDRQALEHAALRHLREMASPNGVTLVLHLATGERYTVHRIAEFLEHHFVAEVFPEGGMSIESLRDAVPTGSKGELIFDRLMLSYATVTYLTLTAREPEHKSTIGFGS
jgi:hypothetical protein